jgi:alcohol dehydrogenase YqhD (iron-dependent ADH family)
MLDFSFQNTTKIIFGKKALDNLAAEILKYSDNILLVYGGNSIKKTGLYDRIVKILNDASITFTELPGVVPNPRLSLARKGGALPPEKKAGLILAGARQCHRYAKESRRCSLRRRCWDFYTKVAAPKTNLPVGTVLTLPAAGSEMSFSSGI